MKRIVLMMLGVLAYGSPQVYIDSNSLLGELKIKSVDVLEMDAPIQQRGNISNRVIGGYTATISDWNFMAGLIIGLAGYSYSGTSCGGSIIGNDVIVTAAHCLDGDNGLKKTDFEVLINTNNQQANNNGEYKIPIKKVIIHEDYGRTSSLIKNDIALVVLNLDNQSTEVKDYLKNNKIKLFNSSNQVPIQGKLAGWGLTTADANASASQYLQELTLPIVPNDTCNINMLNKYNLSLDPSEMCAGVLSGGQDACQGDSGGPLVVEENGVKYLRGLVSWGFGCGRLNEYGIYTDVGYMYPWILSKVSLTDYTILDSRYQIPDMTIELGKYMKTLEKGWHLISNFNKLDEQELKYIFENTSAQSIFTYKPSSGWTYISDKMAKANNFTSLPTIASEEGFFVYIKERADNNQYTRLENTTNLASYSDRISKLSSGWHMLGTYNFSAVELYSIFANKGVSQIAKYNGETNTYSTITKEEINSHYDAFVSFGAVKLYDAIWIYKQ